LLLPCCAPAEKGSFCRPKERYWPQIGPIFDNYSNLVNHLTWPDHAPDGYSAKSDPVFLKPKNYIFVLKTAINITNLAFCWAIEIVA